MLNDVDIRLIRVEARIFSVQKLCEMIDAGLLDLPSTVEGDFIWSNVAGKSSLIESILLRIPIPALYLAQDGDGKFQVVDGVQRLTALYDFMNNRFSLKDLDYLKDFEGKPYEGIEPVYQKRFCQTQLTCNVIDPVAPDEVRDNIVRRIKTCKK